MMALQFDTKQDALDFSHNEAIAHGNSGETTYQYAHKEIDGNHYLNITGSILSTTDYELIDIEEPIIEGDI